MMNKKDLENLIYEYHWRKKELVRIEGILFGNRIPMSKSVGVSQYGIEATLPHGSSGKSIAELKDMDLREERLYRRWEEYREKVFAIEMFAENTKDEQQLVIIDCMMEGMSYRSIAAHLGMSRNKLGEIKNSMLDHLCQICQKDQKCHFVQNLFDKKSA